MTILYILSGTAMGGATHSALSLIENLKERGCNIIVVIPKNDNTFVGRLNNNGIRHYVVFMRSREYPTFDKPLDYWRWPIRLISILHTNSSAKRKIVNIIEKEKVDIVHTNVGVITCGYEASLARRIPHVWHIREYGDKDFNIRMFPSKRLFQKSLRNSYSISITKDLMNYHHLSEQRNACVIYNGVRKQSETCLHFPKKNYFLCASRISPEKGFSQILRVFAKFQKLNPSYRLVILGFDPHNYSSQLIKQAENYGIKDFIDFEGYKDNVSEYMAYAKALLVASPSEGFGRMTAEASFAGCLVVGKNTAGTKEIMNITGGYPFNTDEEMLTAMNNIVYLTEKEYRTKAIYAQQQAVACFSEENYVDRVYSLYKEVLRTNMK